MTGSRWPRPLDRITSLSIARPGQAPDSQEAATRPTFEALYDQYFDFVWRSLLRLSVPASQVEDAVQDTFVVVHRRLDSLRPDASPKAFLFGISLRVAKDYRRRLRRKGTVSLDLDLEPARAADPYQRSVQTELARKLERFLSSLAEDKRAVFCAYELEGMTAPEISQALAIDLSSVYSKLRTAREHLTSFLASEEEPDHG